MPTRTVKAKVTKVSPLTKAQRPRSLWGGDYSARQGFVISIPKAGDVPVFIDSRMLDAHDARQFLSKPRVVGHVLTCSGKTWDIEAEPLERDRFGIVIYTEKNRKAILAGTGTLRSGGGLSFDVETLYSGITNPGGTHTIEGHGEVEGGGSSGAGNGSQPKWKVTVTITYSF